jgi:hypothetical protein
MIHQEERFACEGWTGDVDSGHFPRGDTADRCTCLFEIAGRLHIFKRT